MTTAGGKRCGPTTPVLGSGGLRRQRPGHLRLGHLHNRRRITTRLSQLRTGKRYAHAPPSTMRRIISNIEILGLTERS